MADDRTGILRKFSFGPVSETAWLIIENSDGEGGAYDIYNGALTDLKTAAEAIRELEVTNRTQRVAYWKRVGWNGVFYETLSEYVLIVVDKSGERFEYSIPEEKTGL